MLRKIGKKNKIISQKPSDSLDSFLDSRRQLFVGVMNIFSNQSSEDLKNCINLKRKCKKILANYLRSV